MDVLQNLSAGSGPIPAEGPLVNKGLITNDGGYGWSIAHSGDLHNEGEISNSGAFLDGQSERHLSAGPEGVFDTFVFLPEFQGGTIVADSDLHFQDGVGLGGGELVLAPGSDLRFSSWGSASDGTILAGGNTVLMDGYGSHFTDMRLDQALLEGQVRLEFGVEFTGGLTVAGILENREYLDRVATVSGTLVVEGAVRDKVHALHLRVRGDAANLGEWSNARVVLDGEADQRVGTGPGIGVPHFVLDARLAGGPFQWYRDGEPLPGETADSLVFAGLGETEHGVYHCTGGGETSRLIHIAGELDATGAGAAPTAFALEPNYPNPFNPATNIAFSLPAAGPAHLSVYDAAGRLVETLVDGVLDAGRHSVPWRPTDRASGIYLYRLSYAGGDRVGRAVLIK